MLATENPKLANNISAESPDDLRNWHKTGELHAITAHNHIVGLLAIAPGHVRWIKGYEVNEEVISSPHAGHGYAASAQKAWAHRPTTDPDRLLLGTINRHNTASRRTAENAGRQRILDATFMPLPSQRHPH
jgi:hypothetical protein